jgi:hypothetical protein
MLFETIPALKTQRQEQGFDSSRISFPGIRDFLLPGRVPPSRFQVLLAIQFTHRLWQRLLVETRCFPKLTFGWPFHFITSTYSLVFP